MQEKALALLVADLLTCAFGTIRFFKLSWKIYALPAQWEWLGAFELTFYVRREVFEGRFNGGSIRDNNRAWLLKLRQWGAHRHLLSWGRFNIPERFRYMGHKTKYVDT